MADNKTALVIIHVQMAFFQAPKPLHRADALLKTIQGLIAKARASHIPIIYVQSNASGDLEWMNSTPLKNIHADIEPIESDLVIQDWQSDIFAEATLPAELEAQGIKKLILTGLQTEYCINNSCRSGASRGYDITLVSDAHSTFDSDTQTAKQIIDQYEKDLGKLVTVKRAKDISLTSTV